jgi:CHASE3 domain sensor protein
MRAVKQNKSVRRSVALPQALVDDAVEAAPVEIKQNMNRLIIVALQEFISRRREMKFEEAMAKMAGDTAIKAECGIIAREFSDTDKDGLGND